VILKALRGGLLGVVLGFVSLSDTPCQAGGILHFLPALEEGRPLALERAMVLHSRSRVTVSDSSLEYVMDQTFYNNNEQSLEATFLLPFDAGSPSGNTSVTVNGTPTAFIVLRAEEALLLITELTLGMGDPSLLELCGRSLLVVRSVQLASKREKSVQVRFTVPRAPAQDQLELRIPLHGERFSLGPVSGLEILVRFKMSMSVRAIFSPTHEVSVTREAPHRAVASFRSENKPVRQDFALIATFLGSDLDLRFFCHRNPRARGSFLAVVSPPLVKTHKKDLPKDIVFVVDRSGSIDKISRGLLEESILHGLEGLGEQDRFNVIAVGTKTMLMQRGLIPARKENIVEAVRYLNTLDHTGGTDLYNGILAGLEQFSSGKRQRFLILVGDGRPTIGVVNFERIGEGVRKANRLGVRIFAVALGDRADTALLGQLTEGARGTVVHLRRSDGFESDIRRFYESISAPAVTDLTLDFENIVPEEIIPDTIPDVSSQDGAFLLGRYYEERDVSSRVSLRARVHGRMQTISRSFDFPAITEARPYIPVIWGMRKMARLMERERTKGPEPAIIEDMSSLADEFGFKKVLSGKYPGRDWGKLYWAFRTSLIPSEVEAEGFKRIGAKLFRREVSGLVDCEFRPFMEVREITFLSDEYFQLIKTDPVLGTHLSIGPDVTIVRQGKALKIVSMHGNPSSE
jgi:Ca-activated chloride channel family protein